MYVTAPTLALTRSATASPTRNLVPRLSFGQRYCVISFNMAQSAFRCSALVVIFSASKAFCLLVAVDSAGAFVCSDSGLRLSTVPVADGRGSVVEGIRSSALPWRRLVVKTRFEKTMGKRQVLEFCGNVFVSRLAAFGAWRHIRKVLLSMVDDSEGTVPSSWAEHGEVTARIGVSKGVAE